MEDARQRVPTGFRGHASRLFAGRGFSPPPGERNGVKGNAPLLTTSRETELPMDSARPQAGCVFSADA